MISINFKTGNFDLDIKGEFNADSMKDALEAALKYQVQRDIASKVYVELAGVKGAKGGKVLPEGFERESVEYTADNATAFLEAAKLQLAKIGTFEVSVSERQEASASSDALKQAVKDAKAYIARGEEVAQKVADAIKAKCGVVVENPMDEEELAQGLSAMTRFILAEAKKTANLGI